jgi:hypothetical protein
MEKYSRYLMPLGIFVYLLISISTYHPDIRAFLLASKFISSGEVLTFYDHVSKLPPGDPTKSIFGDDILFILHWHT